MTTVADDDQESPAKYLTAVITAQPANAVGVIGGQVSFAFTFAAVIPAEFTFQWQIQTDGATWGDLVESMGFYEGVTTQTLTVKAIDNWMGSQTSLNFRCRLLFAGAVSTFTSSASLTIPIRVDWNFTAFFRSAAVLAGNVAVFNIAAPVTHGLTGPLTYLWSTLSGPLTFVDATAAAPQVLLTAGVSLSVASFSCVISDGTHSVRTSTYFVASLVRAATLYPGGAAVGAFSSASHPLHGMASESIPYLPGVSLTSAWSSIVQISGRYAVAPVVTIDTTDPTQSTFTLSATPAPGTYFLSGNLAGIFYDPGVPPTGNSAQQDVIFWD